MGQSRLARPARWLAAIFSICAAVGIAHASSITDRMTLIEAIDSVRNTGVEIAYSSQLVKPWLRVRSTPADPDPVLALREVLAEHALDR